MIDYKFSHVGIPTKDAKKWDGFYEAGKIHFTDFNNDPYGIEWVQFEQDSPMPPLMQEVPHVAYYVDDLDEALQGKEILVDIFSPSEGVRVAFIVHDNAPIEFMEVKN